MGSGGLGSVFETMHKIWVHHTEQLSKWWHCSLLHGLKACKASDRFQTHALITIASLSEPLINTFFSALSKIKKTQ